ncbi:hypothetical protein CPB83DRAFT_896760 [Crepidotus variabilis]|uniref:Tyrosinase copper-binding domain-containing protein n=1 Tax=Crepidotus variabilis TaxID=179855 RepID=A0A9P6EB66_9AGAR|nr:hypothetical protein CPB83DRAFT_896760 [Crepidotus variabilis]
MAPFLSPLAPPVPHDYTSECLNPTVRKDWRTLSGAERTGWISAVKCLANMPHNTSVARLNMTFVHNDLIEIIHGTGLFFPWHRHHLHVPDLENVFFWSDSDPESGLGGWGNPDADIQVEGGGFARFKLAYPSPHNLRRHFRVRP